MKYLKEFIKTTIREFLNENYNSKNRLYRIENPNIPYDESREGDVSNKDLLGQFFIDNIKDLMFYVRKNQREPGIRLVYVDLTPKEKDKYHVSKNPLAPKDVEPNNWLIPFNNMIKRNYVDLSGLPKLTGNTISFNLVEQKLEDIINNLP